MAREIESFTDEEIVLFAETLKFDIRSGEFTSQSCITSALCTIGCQRRTPLCGRVVEARRQTIDRYIPRLLDEAQKHRIIDFCLDDEISKTHASAYQYLGKGLYITLAALVPFYPTRDPERWREFLGKGI